MLKSLVGNLVGRYSDYCVRKDEMRRFMEQAVATVAESGLKNKDRILEDYKKDLRRYMFNFDEWFNLYDCFGKSYNYKRKFISRSEAQKWYRHLNRSEVRKSLINKSEFLKIIGQDKSGRETLTVSEETPESTVKDFIRTHDIIAKPEEGTLGRGIFKIPKGVYDSKGLERIMHKLTGGGIFLKNP